MEPLIGAALIGAGASIFGSVLGASGASKAAKAQAADAARARELYDYQTLLGMGRFARELYGGQGALDYLRGQLTAEQYNRLFGRPASQPTLTEEQQRKLSQIEERISGINRILAGRGPFFTPTTDAANDMRFAELRRLEAQRRAILEAAGQREALPGLFDVSAYAGGQEGIIPAATRLAAEEEERTRGLLGSYDTDTETLRYAAEQNILDASRFGEQERRRIQLESERALRGLNRLTEGRLMGAGLGGSTLLAQQLAGNQRSIREQTENMLGSLSDRQIQLLSQLRGEKLATLAGRFSGRSALEAGVLERLSALRAQPLNMRLALASSPIMNPWLEQNTMQYFPGVSPSGSALSTIGNTLAGAGGTILGAAMRSWFDRQTPQKTTSSQQSDSTP